MILFKHNSTGLFDRLSTKYPDTVVDIGFLLMQGRHNLYLKFHVHAAA